MDTSVFHEIFVELLEVAGGQLGKFDLADPWDGVGLDHQLIAICGGKTDIGLGVEVIPGFQPGGDGVFLGTDHIEIFSFFQYLCQFGLDFGLGFTKDIFDDPLAGDRIVSGGVTTFPATVASLADVSFAVSAAFCHGASLLSLVATTHTTLWQRKLSLSLFSAYQNLKVYMDGPI